MPSPTASDLDIADAPFSRRRHWLGLTSRAETEQGVLYLRTARGAVTHRTLLRMELEVQGQAVPSELAVSAGSVRLTCAQGSAEFALDGTSTLRVRLRGEATLLVSVYDQPYSSSFECETGRWHLNLNAARARIMATTLRGRLVGEAPFIPGKSDTAPAQLRLSAAASGEAELELTEFESTWVAPATRPAFDAIIAETEAGFEEWFAAFGEFPARWADLARRAAFVLWSNTSPAAGYYAHPAVMMSQNAMIGIWSWDHCFVALALAKAHPRQAWEQWWLPFVHQTEEGMLPDHFTDAGREYAMTKPPVHGWALKTLLQHYSPPETDLQRAYHALERWTQWWLTHRDDDHDGIAQYNHGCESGWDNDSLCCGGLPCESADLSVYLVQQQETLALLAEKLGRSSDAARWRASAAELRQRLLSHSWTGERFIAPQSGSHALGSQGDCLRQFWPLLLGKELPGKIADTLLEGLLEPGRFRTAHGFATESPRSSFYKADGYWLGPIWAPSTWQVVEMLQLHGHPEEAARTMQDFCEMCEKQGFRENFDAQTGEGLRDRGFAWTAAVCLRFLQEIR